MAFRALIALLVAGCGGAAGSGGVLEGPAPSSAVASEPATDDPMEPGAAELPAPADPPSVRAGISAEPGCLPEELEAILVRASSERPVLDPGAPTHAISVPSYVLVPDDGRLRRILMDDARELSPVAAELLGIRGSVVRARVTLGTWRGCPIEEIGSPGPVTIVSATPLEPDYGAVVDGLAAELDDGASADRLEAAARDAAEAAGHDLPGTVGRPRAGRALMVRPEAGGLSVLLLVRAYRDSTTTGPSGDPHAGSFWCEAPPGADCAPQCVPPRETVTVTVVGESGIRFTLDALGAVTSREELAAGVLANRPSTRRGIGDCER